jgi:hypothetical protein
MLRGLRSSLSLVRHVAGFALFESVDDAIAALEELNGTVFDPDLPEMALVVQMAKRDMMVTDNRKENTVSCARPQITERHRVVRCCAGA